MRVQKIKIPYVLLALTIILLLAACIDEKMKPEEEVDVIDDKIRVELFTRIDPYNIPSARGSANENSVDMKPWVIVFKGSDTTFVEAVQTTEIGNQRYVILTKQTEPCWLLILANPQEWYYINATQSFKFSSTTFETALTGMSLYEACRVLRTEPLSNPQTTIPFVNAQNNMLLPMSQIVELPSGINENTQIGSTSNQLELNRAVARLEIINTVSHFDFKGITAIMNASKQGLLHNLTGTMIDVADNLVEYKYDNMYSDDIAKAITSGTQQATTTNPVYLYEAQVDNGMYLIIRGIYDNEVCYYKLAVVDEDENPLDIQRNHRYIFNIIAANGPGYSSVDDAKISQASNTNLNYTITVRDESSYEIISNNDYYLGVSNSHYIVYGDVGTSKEFHAFTVSTDCEREFDKRTITPSSGLILTNPISNTLPIVQNTSPEKTDIKISLENTFNNGTVLLELGNLEKTVKIERRAALDYNSVTLTFPEFYCLSGYVEETSAHSWLKLVPSSGIRETTDQIIVEDGVINVLLERNRSGAERYGTIYLTTIINPNTSRSSIFRIKLYITQKREIINSN